jgi:hypothetical protein
MEATSSAHKNVEAGFAKILNRHGYGFHYSVLKLAHDLCDRGESRWAFEAAEFPVQVQEETTRIDFILRLRHRYPIYLLAECKRANPALSNWCFAQASYVRRNRTMDEPFFIEQIRQVEDESICASATTGLSVKDACHIAIEVKSNEKGDDYGSGRGEIERAVTQVCRGLNGMTEFLSENAQVLSEQTAFLLPVIFTTARIWRSSVDLSSASVLDGTIDLTGTDFEQVPWAFYQYHLSPGLKHMHSPTDRPSTIGALMDSEYIRTITVVTASDIESFLRWSSDPDWWLTW